MARKNSKIEKTKLKDNQMYFMIFYSEYREYISYGTNLRIMAEHILAKYNSWCEADDRFDTLEDLVKGNAEQDLNYHFYVYVVDLNTAMDSECWHDDNYLGDYLEMIL